MNLVETPDWLTERCPHCGQPLISRHDRFVHLTQKQCQGGAGGEGRFDFDDLTEGTREPAPPSKD